MTISIFSGRTHRRRIYPASAARLRQCVDVAALGVPFIARAGFDEDPLPCRANEKKFIASRMRLRSSAGDLRSHMGFGNHAEHGAAIEAKRSVGEKVEFDVAESHDVGSTFYFGAACK